MKLLNVYVAGFGNLQDQSFSFTDGINVFSRPNGWGKSTFAAFVRSMFYGLGDSRARSVAENARKRYTPWQGGSFGGNLEFEVGGKGYRIERFFGAKESEDTFELFALDTGKPSGDYTERIGEELFGIDADGFARTVFMDASAHVHGKVEKNANNSINTKLNHLLEAENDLGNYEQAMEALVKRKRYYKTTGERGEIYAGERRLIALQGEIERCLAAKEEALGLEEQIAALTPEIKACEARMQALREQLSRAVTYRDRRSVLDTYSRMHSEVTALRRRADALREQFKGEVPTAKEAERYQLTEGQLRTLAGRAQQIMADKTIDRAMADMATTFENGVTPLSEVDRALEICRDLRVIEEEIRNLSARAAALQAQMDDIGDLAPPTPSWQGRKATLGKAMGVVYAVLCVVLLVSGAIMLVNAKLFLGILCGVLGIGMLVLCVLTLLRAVSAAQISGRAKRAADVAVKLQTKKSLGEEREQLLARAQQQKERYTDLAALPVELAQKHGLDVDGGYIGALTALRQATVQYLRLEEQKRARVQAYEEIIREADDLWDALCTFLGRWNKPFTREDCAFVLAELRTQLAELQRLGDEIEAKEASVAKYALDHNVRGLAEMGTREEDAALDAEQISADWEASQEQYKQMSAQLSQLSQRTEQLFESADAYGTLVAEKQALEENLAAWRANYEAIVQAEKFMEQARENLSSRYLVKMQTAFTQRMQAMGGELQFSMDTDFGIMLRAKGKSRSIEYLSSGWRDMVGFCLRLALADGLFDAEKPCLILDDPFVYLDSEHAAAAKRVLDDLAKDYQILYFTCKE